MSAEELRPGWRRLPFKEIAESITERVEDPSAAGVDRYVGLEHLDPESTRIRRWGSPEDVASTKLRFYPGDVVYGRRRAYQRKLGVADFEGICSAHALVLRAKPETCLPEFLPYFLQSDAFHERAVGISVGSLSPTINWKTLAKEEFALPPLDEQKRIAEAVSAVDGAFEAGSQVIKSLLTTEEALLEAASCEATSASPLGDVASVQYGLTLNKKRAELPRSHPYLRVANVHRWSIVLDEVKSVGVADTELARFALEDGDILVVEGHASADQVGRAAICATPVVGMLHQNHLLRIRCEEGVSPVFVAAMLNSRSGRRYFSSRAKSTSGLNTINSSVLKDFPLPRLDPSSERLLSERLVSLRRVLAEVTANHAVQRSLRCAVLGQLLGKVAA